MKNTSICRVDQKGDRIWYDEYDRIHRDNDLPAIITVDGIQRWYLHGDMHRIKGPAYISPTYMSSWWQYGKRHRTDGPAIERVSGSREWYLYDKRHRTDGPAVIDVHGKGFWYINGDLITTMEEYRKLTNISNELISVLILKYGDMLQGTDYEY